MCWIKVNSTECSCHLVFCIVPGITCLITQFTTCKVIFLVNILLVIAVIYWEEGIHIGAMFHLCNLSATTKLHVFIILVIFTCTLRLFFYITYFAFLTFPAIPIANLSKMLYPACVLVYTHNRTYNLYLYVI